MARKSMQQLEEEALKRKSIESSNDITINNQSSLNSVKNLSYDEKIIGELLQKKQQTARYKIPDQVILEKITHVPKVIISDYPEINVRGSFPVERQKRGANLLLLKEIDNILLEIDVGNNRNATLNFLIWVGLQTLKGMKDRVDVKVNENTFADGGAILEFE